ncbi:hypothetical protein SDC9_91572 [bioreactor metagenome]|jgi:hypothetical protein|uniref:Uncharacterized protein n=1 Tax=bioreactor metagenome TaxID=1076179 RepID=A0A644ZVA6_9ZZZZ
MDSNFSQMVSTSEESNSSKLDVKYFILAIFLVVAIFFLGFFTQKILLTSNDNTVEKQAQVTTLQETKHDTKPEVCTWSSGWYGFTFQYLLKDSVNQQCEYADDELTSAVWPKMPENLTMYPRSGLSGKAWWREMIHDEAAFLPEGQYLFEASQLDSGIEVLSVRININTVFLEKDGVDPGPDRGSDYYFGENWVIRSKVFTSGGPDESQELFINSLQPIPIEKVRG